MKNTVDFGRASSIAGYEGYERYAGYKRPGEQSDRRSLKRSNSVDVVQMETQGKVRFVISGHHVVKAFVTDWMRCTNPTSSISTPDTVLAHPRPIRQRFIPRHQGCIRSWRLCLFLSVCDGSPKWSLDYLTGPIVVEVHLPWRSRQRRDNVELGRHSDLIFTLEKKGILPGPVKQTNLQIELSLQGVFPDKKHEIMHALHVEELL